MERSDKKGLVIILIGQNFREAVSDGWDIRFSDPNRSSALDEAERVRSSRHQTCLVKDGSSGRVVWSVGTKNYDPVSAEYPANPG